MAEPKRASRKRTKKTKISDIDRQISILLDTGKVVLGYNKSIKDLLLGETKLVIYAHNIQPERKKDLLYYAELGDIKAVEYPGTSLALGKLCGKLFPVTIISVKDLGEAEF